MTFGDELAFQRQGFCMSESAHVTIDSIYNAEISVQSHFWLIVIIAICKP